MLVAAEWVDEIASSAHEMLGSFPTFSWSKQSLGCAHSVQQFSIFDHRSGGEAE
jgi:hypothetical protein